MQVTRRYLLTGRVQGVGYRMFAADSARREGLAGHVRNLPDGSVEAVAAGDLESLTRFEAALWRGPSHARVEAVDVTDTAPLGLTGVFAIRQDLGRYMEHLKSKIRHVPDFPKPGILFYDITTLLADSAGFRDVIDALAAPYAGQGIDRVVGIESRGFILAAAVADRLGAGFVPIRKPGKLPSATITESYALEYGTDRLEMHVDAVGPGHRVLVVDDVLATGGTARAAVNLVQRLGSTLHGTAFLIELDVLKGRDQLTDARVFSVLRY